VSKVDADRIREAFCEKISLINFVERAIRITDVTGRTVSHDLSNGLIKFII
jgi:hypothetical protein